MSRIQPPISGSATPTVFLVCTGLGRINRGYESFTRECFETLIKVNSFKLFLLKGGGNKSPQQRVPGHIPRNSPLAHFVSKITGKDRYFIEQFSFFIGMLPLLLRKRPDVIYYSDFQLGTFLWHLRRFLGFKYKLLFSNGAPNGPPYSRTDHVQQLLPYYMEIALAANEPEAKNTLVPYGIKMPATDGALHEKVLAIKRKAGGRKIILSVGAINSTHKRMDYVITEFAGLNRDEYFLVILGQFEDETKSIVALAEANLKRGDYLIDNVSSDEVNYYYQAADYFMLASLWEGFGRVLLEAAAIGLPVIVHDYVIARQVLGNTAFYMDMNKKGELAQRLQQADMLQWNNTKKQQQIEYIREQYGWDSLSASYTKMINSLMN